jgi:leucyl aminopeptidase
MARQRKPIKMAVKPGDNFPNLKLVDSNSKPERIFAGKSSVALAVSNSSQESQNLTDQSKFKFSNIAFTKLVEKYFEINFSEKMTDWPEFQAKAGEIIEIPVRNGSVRRIFLVGIGEAKPEELRKAASALGRKVKGQEVDLLTAIASNRSSIINTTVALVLSNYFFWIKSDKQPKLITFHIFGDYEAELIHAIALAKAVWRARDLIHTPSNIKNPLWLANEVKRLVKKVGGSNLKVVIKSGSQLKEFGGLLAVGNSSPKPGPRFIQLTYSPKGVKNFPHVVLVGKGITFDTGGVSLKRPYDIMVPMKSDMAGVAAVLSAVLSLPITKPKVKVTALLMCAENSLSATSQRPSDVIKHYGGTTVEVINTDAEGRLVLADGLAFADLNLAPDYLIDVATLTGAATLGLGKQYAAMYTRDNRLAKELSRIGDEVGERVWQMPLVDDYSIALESDVADYNHVADKYNFSAGSVTAALFLEKFVGKRKWVHLDIAGPARSEIDSGENIKGGTGFAARLLTEWLARFN